VALGVAGPASAQTTTVVDGADATASLSDIRRVAVAPQIDKVVVRTTFTDLTTDSVAGLRINIDTDAARVGPEFVLVSGLGDGTDYFLLEARDWRVVGEPLTCSHILRIDWDTDVARFAASRACLGNPDQVRVGVRMTDAYDSSHPVTDWMTGYRAWTPWMARG
jgi:hypothetical protein